MAKSRRMMEEALTVVDIVIELLDARIPKSSGNPEISRLAANKKRIVVINKSDLADASMNARWIKHFRDSGVIAQAVESSSGKGVGAVVSLCRELTAEKTEREKKKGRISVPLKAMVAGIPNVGKSTFINRLAGGSPARIADRPGVTRGRQWIKVKSDFFLLDTPGILWPKQDDADVGLKLAMTGAISDNIPEPIDLAMQLIIMLGGIKPEAIYSRYKIEERESAEASAADILESIGISRGYLQKGGGVDLLRTAIIFIDEYRGGKLGRISLETPGPS